MRRLSMVLTAVLLAMAGCGPRSTQANDAPGKKGGDGVPVLAATVTKKDVPLELQVIGNAEAYSTVSVRAQVTGPLVKVHFTEGEFVKKGDLLFTIDPLPFEAALREAEANLLKSEAQLAQARATLKRDQAQATYAKAQADRYSGLMKEGIFAKDQTEQVQASADAALESVRADEASIKSAEASIVAGRATVDSMRIQLSYTTIRSPVDGRTGNLAVKEGNLVTANTMELITINQVQPIYVTFSVPESSLNEIRSYMDAGKLEVTAAPQDGGKPEKGVLKFVDNAVDPTTGTIKLKGVYANADRQLWPGQFIRVTLRLATQKEALVAPSQAVQEGQDGQFVYVVKPDQTVEVRPVKTGSRLGQETVIASGLEPGETVVTEGQLRLTANMKVRIRAPGEGGRGGPRPGGVSPK
jgi:membrane fusion protein, multidrug efflux system